jgi:hypothetical protein
MNEKEIKTIISYDKKATKLYMPNEIFEDLVACKEFKKDGSSHISFAYGYTYLCTWLYRYCNFFQTEPITQERLKEIMGYTATYKNLDYIIKKNGLLEQLGYLETTTDYPLTWEMDEDKILNFQTVKTYKLEFGKIPETTSRNFKVKLPTKAFHRTNESLESQLLDGTFYDVYSTHMISIEVFMYCMAKEDIGVIGFYLYAFIKNKNDLFQAGVDISLKEIADQTGIKATTLTTYLTRLKEFNMIDCRLKPYVFNLPQRLWEANTYNVKEHEFFGNKATPVEKRKVMSLYTYEKEYGIIDTLDNNTGSDFLQLANTIDIDDNLLPF